MKHAKPTTLQQAIRHFTDEQTCIDALAAIRWPDGVECVACGHKQHYYLAKQRRWKCKDCGRQFSVKLNSIFEDSPIGLDKWMVAIWMLANCKNGVSSYELAKTIGVTQKSAWFMLHRIRLAMKAGSLEKDKIGGGGSEVECDETHVGGKAEFMHKDKKLRLIQVRNETPNWKATTPYKYGGNKTPVMGMLDRQQRKIRATVVPNIRREALQSEILKNVHHGSKLYTDESASYVGIAAKQYAHEVVNHMERYVSGRIHTNGLENFWSLLKRGLRGTYVAVEPYHLGRYVDEQVFRFNHRMDNKGNKIGDAERFDAALAQVTGKRLTFAEVTGKVGETAF